MRKCVIFGATSAMAMETAKYLAADHDEILLVARNEEHLNTIKSDLLTRGASKVDVLPWNASDCSSHSYLLGKLEEICPLYDTVLFAYGSLGDQKACELDFSKTYDELNTNFLSVISLLTHIANRFEAQGTGTIACISSVAGDRGRQSNYIYGTAKGALSIFLQGLRNRLYSKGVSVITIKPGFVSTPMTANIPTNKLFISSAQAGKAIYNAIDKKRDVVYVAWYWFFIMLIIKAIPDFLFKRQNKI